MNKIEKQLLWIFLTMILFLSCNDTTKKDSDSTKKNDLFKKNLIENQLGKSNLYVSLPNDYIIKENLGPDFEVYYFMPIDTNNVQNFSGGFYLGNHPSEFERTSDSCKTKFIESHVFDKQRKWKIYDCAGKFSMQLIINNENSEDWNQKIHAFGNAKSKDDLDKLIKIHTTLNSK